MPFREILRRYAPLQVFANVSQTVGTMAVATDHGYHLVHWTDPSTDGWAISDLNVPELEQFVARYRGGGSTATKQ